MKTQYVSAQNFGANKILIKNAGNNKKVNYLFNKVVDIVKEQQPTAVFNHECIDIRSDSTRQTKNITRALRKENIEYSVDGKESPKGLAKTVQKIIDYFG